MKVLFKVNIAFTAALVFRLNHMFTLKQKEKLFFFREYSCNHELNQIAISKQILNIELPIKHVLCLMINSPPLIHIIRQTSLTRYASVQNIWQYLPATQSEPFPSNYSVNQVDNVLVLQTTMWLHRFVKQAFHLLVDAKLLLLESFVEVGNRWHCHSSARLFFVILCALLVHGGPTFPYIFIIVIFFLLIFFLLRFYLLEIVISILYHEYILHECSLVHSLGEKVSDK